MRSEPAQGKSNGGDGQGRARHLFFHCTPPKFPQGHDLFTSDDLVALLRQKTARRWSLRLYCKGEEINAPEHRLTDQLQQPELVQWADIKLCAELPLRTTELVDLNLRTASSLSADSRQQLSSDYLRTLEMNEQSALTNEKLPKLPKQIYSTNAAWPR